MAHDFVDIWYGRTGLDPDVIDNLTSFLDDGERQKAQSFKLALIRDRYIAVRGLLRQTLGGYLNIAPASLQFDIGEYGKPRLLCDSLHFNLSHTGEHLLIAVGNFPDIGIDVERINQRSNLTAIAQRIFSKDEHDQWQQLSPDQQLEAFYRLWTKKEAFVKAVGRGIALGMELCELELEQGGQFIAIPSAYGGVSDWQVIELAVPSGLSAALAARRCGFRLDQKEIPIGAGSEFRR